MQMRLWFLLKKILPVMGALFSITNVNPDEIFFGKQFLII